MEVVLSTEHRYNAFEQRYALELQCMNPSAFGKPGVMYLRCIEKEFPFLAPDLVEGLALGHLKVGVSQLLRDKVSASWSAQREALDAGRC
ncbi:hypothetical protein ACNFIA_31730 [Pseudomonas sp. NY15437]|uniref:hypothetical protein n=1 Tax=Pseudomonas sp. NY15437 TaxID=3400360 RepID=UPI003A8AEC27